ncbi:MAG: hypothetical protein QOE35_323 [Actinomycetota bacterium]
MQASQARLDTSGLRWPRPATTVWALPVAVYYFVRHSQDGALERGVAVLLAVGALALVRRHPGRALLVLLALLPFQVVILSYLLKLGVPEAVIRPLGSWRDLIILGLALAAYRDFVNAGRRLDTLDKLALGYIVLVTAYLLMPDVFVRGATDTFLGAPKDWETRLLAYRIDIGFVLLFLAARHATALEHVRDRAMRVVIVTGAVVAAVAIYEFSFSSSWNTFAIQTLQVPLYSFRVLHTVPADWGDIRHYVFIGGSKVVRPGTTFFDPLHAAFYLLAPLACGVELITRNKARWALLTTSLIAVALLMTNVRSAVIGAVVIVAVAVRQRSGRTSANRVRVATLLALGMLLLVPVAASSGFSSRSSQATDTSDDSTSAHLAGFWNGVHALGDDPLGRGLGTQPGVGDRFRVQTKVTSEDAYLQVGNELGIPTMIVFIILIGVLLRSLRRAADIAWDVPLASAARTAAWGLVVGGLFLHVWLYYGASFTMWGLAGMALRAAESRQLEPTPAPYRIDVPRPTAVAVDDLVRRTSRPLRPFAPPG